MRQKGRGIFFLALFLLPVYKAGSLWLQILKRWNISSTCLAQKQCLARTFSRLKRSDLL